MSVSRMFIGTSLRPLCSLLPRCFFLRFLLFRGLPRGLLFRFVRDLFFSGGFHRIGYLCHGWGLLFIIGAARLQSTTRRFFSNGQTLDPVP